MTAGPLSQGTCLHSGIKMQGFTAIPRTGQHSGAPHGGEGSSFGKKGTRKAPTLRAPLHVCAHLPCSLGAIFQGRPKFVPLIQKWSGPLETLMRPREGKTSSHTRLLSKFVPRADAPGSKGSLEVPRGRWVSWQLWGWCSAVCFDQPAVLGTQACASWRTTG